MIFCPNWLGQKNVHLCSSLNDLYLLLVHPLKWIAIWDTLILKFMLIYMFYDIFNIKPVNCTLKMPGIYAKFELFLHFVCTHSVVWYLFVMIPPMKTIQTFKLNVGYLAAADCKIRPRSGCTSAFVTCVLSIITQIPLLIIVTHHP